MGSDSLMVLHDRVVVVGGGLVQSCDLVEVVLHACGGWTRGVIGVCVRVRVRVRESPWMRTEPLTRLDVLQQHRGSRLDRALQDPQEVRHLEVYHLQTLHTHIHRTHTHQQTHT